MAIEIVDLPINIMVIFHSYVSLPEGNHGFIHDLWGCTILPPDFYESECLPNQIPSMIPYSHYICNIP